MGGFVRITYWLGWICLVLAVLGRIALMTTLSKFMVDWGVMPRNFLQMTFLFFVVSIASHFCGESPKT